MGTPRSKVGNAGTWQCSALIDSEAGTIQLGAQGPMHANLPSFIPYKEIFFFFFNSRTYNIFGLLKVNHRFIISKT